MDLETWNLNEKLADGHQTVLYQFGALFLGDQLFGSIPNPF